MCVLKRDPNYGTETIQRSNMMSFIDYLDFRKRKNSNYFHRLRKNAISDKLKCENMGNMKSDS
jgi:hypothetical protein